MHNNHTLAEFMPSKIPGINNLQKVAYFSKLIEGMLYKTIRIIIILWKNCKFQTVVFLSKSPSHLHQRKQENMPVS